MVLTCLTGSGGGGGGGDPVPEPTPTPEPRPAPEAGPSSSPSPTDSRNGPVLSWSHVPASNFYRIYRAACPTCPKEQVGRVAGDRFTDTSASPGRMYYYFLRTENPGGLSGYSDWIPAWRYEQDPGRTGDFDGDEIWDILWWNPGSGEVTVWYLEADRSAAMTTTEDSWLVRSKASLNAAMTGNATLSYTGDLNGDRRDDLLWRDYTSGQVTVWLLDGADSPALNGPPSFQEGYSARKQGGADLAGDSVTQEDQPASIDLPGVTDSLDWQVCGLGDVSGDGKADVVWLNSADQRVAVWLMDG